MRPPFILVAPRVFIIGWRAVASRPPPFAPLLGGVFHSIGFRRSSVAVAKHPPCQKSLTIFLSSTKFSYTSILFGNVDFYSYLCSAFRIRGNGRPTSERKMPTVSTAMCDERESGKRAALLLPLFT